MGGFEIMKGGRKNLRRASEESALSLQQDQSIMRVESLRGSNVIEVIRRNSCCIFLFGIRWIVNGTRIFCKCYLL